MSLKERLAAKARRTAVVPVQVTDPGPARDRLEQARQVLFIAQMQSKPADDVAAATQAVEAAEADLAACFEQVEFQALAPADMERLTAAHTTEAGEYDETTLPPALAAECALEEDLRDLAWWTAQLDPTTGIWSAGERIDLYRRLLALNLDAPSAGFPKG